MCEARVVCVPPAGTLPNQITIDRIGLSGHSYLTYGSGPLLGLLMPVHKVDGLCQFGCAHMGLGLCFSCPSQLLVTTLCDFSGHFWAKPLARSGHCTKAQLVDVRSGAVVLVTRWVTALPWGSKGRHNGQTRHLKAKHTKPPYTFRDIPKVTSALTSSPSGTSAGSASLSLKERWCAAQHRLLCRRTAHER